MSTTTSASASEPVRKTLSRYRVLLWPAALILLYVFYVNGLSRNPPGFYVDESMLSYNAYQIYLTGRSEHGEAWPLYFTAFREDDGTVRGYVNPTYVYALAALYYVFPPSVMLSRYFSVTVVFLACVLLGLLAARISGSRSIGGGVGLTALLTPWLFELSRLVFEVALYPLALVLFLLAVHRAHVKERWSLLDCAAMAAALAFATYTYTGGRLLGPLLAVGLLSFATNRRRLLDVIKVCVCYGLTLVPLLVFALRHPGALSGRYNMLSYVRFDKPLTQLAWEFVKAYTQDIGPGNLLLSGDPLLRHHVPGMGMLFAATLILAAAGIVYVLVRCRRDPWWRFVLYGALIAALPGALTVDRAHMLRLVALPVFLLLLTVPALMWLLGTPDTARLSPAPAWLRGGVVGRSVRRKVLLALLVLTLLQAALFQVQFRREGLKRGHVFDDAYPKILDEALAAESGPVYLIDGPDVPAYIHAYWYSTVRGLDSSRFIRLTGGARPPAGSLVLGSERQCSSCQVLSKRGSYILYRVL